MAAGCLPFASLLDLGFVLGRKASEGDILIGPGFFFLIKIGPGFGWSPGCQNEGIFGIYWNGYHGPGCCGCDWSGAHMEGRRR